MARLIAERNLKGDEAVGAKPGLWQSVCLMGASAVLGLLASLFARSRGGSFVSSHRGS